MFRTFIFLVTITSNVKHALVDLKMHLGLPWEDYQKAVINEFPRMQAGSSLGTDVCHLMSTWFKVNEMAL